MREIKFRVIIDGKHYYWGWVNNQFVSMPIVSKFGQEDVVARSRQYTGLKDKNGKEIYEGDFLGRYTQTKKIKDLHFIEWIEMSFENDEMLYWEATMTGFSLPKKSYNKLEVIGNIFENPELLK